MARVELRDQRDIINSIKHESGYAKKWASTFIVGVPDLICALPKIGLFLMEIKSIIIESPDRSDHVFKVSPKQLYEMKRFAEAGSRVLLGVVVRAKMHDVTSGITSIHKVLYVMPAWTASFTTFQTLHPLIDGARWNAKKKVYEGITEQIGLIR